MSGRLVAALAALAFAAVPGWAADDGPQTGHFYLSPLGYYMGLPEEQGYQGDAFGAGGALGWAFHDEWAVELTGLRTSEADFDLPGGGSDAETIDNVWANLLYLVPADLPFQPYLTFGGGKGRYERAGQGDRDINEFNLGAGLFKNFNERVSVRGDVRALFLNHDDRDLVPLASLGLAVTLGRLDKPVEADSDGDGVPDSRDKCPGTPPGRRVDADGCELDSDGDGVVDGDDACPGTPPGVKVDSRGCPPPAEPAPVAEPVRFDLTVEFAFDSAEINDLSFRELRRAMQFLRDHPATKAVIEGHTDSRGTDEYNLALSERRAAAVVGVLVNSGIEASRLRSVGFGESRPVASNDTDEGRQRNRRVSIVVSQN